MAESFAGHSKTFDVATRSFTHGTITGGQVIETFGDYADQSELMQVYTHGRRDDTDGDSNNYFIIKTDKYTTDGQSLGLSDWNSWDYIHSQPGDGLPHYLEPGDTWEWYAFAECDVPSSERHRVRQTWAHQDGHDPDLACYSFGFRPDNDEIIIKRYEGDGTKTNLKTLQDVGLHPRKWHRIETYWSDGGPSGENWGDMFFQVDAVESFDANGWADDTTTIAEFSTYDGFWDAAGIGWSFSTDSPDQWWDSLRLL